MNKYKAIINKLRQKGVDFEAGLSGGEFNKIQQIYKIRFPQELHEMLSLALPISDGFYKWRDFSNENVEFIRCVLIKPLTGLLSDLADGYLWCDDWGKRPPDDESAKKTLIENYNKAPQLVPVFSHRYIPFIVNEIEIPVLSVMGSDIIYYGENLIDYLEIEFGYKTYNEMNCDIIKEIPFWSNVMK
jgi:hypothetical protein